MDVNWNEPIEAVHEDGTVQPATNMGGGYVSIGGSSSWWSTDSKGDILSTRWKLRNVQPASAKPSEIDAALVERMVAALRLAADMGSMSHADDIDAAGEAARAIVADLPEPVDADRDAAKSALEECGFAPGHVEDNSLSLQIALAAIKRGRALEREGK